MIEALGYVGVTLRQARRLGRLRRALAWAAARRADADRRCASAWTTASSASSSPDRARLRAIARSGSIFGWEVADAAALDALAARLEAKGVAVARLQPRCAPTRAASPMRSRFRDPSGNVLEAFHGAETTSDPFVPGKPISGFRTGALGMGHVVLRVKNLEPMHRSSTATRWASSCPTIRLTPFVAYFFHVNPRHHSIALIGSDRDAIHHLMVEMCSLDDVGQTYDMALAEPGRIGTTLGRHTNDHVTSFYANTPSDFMMEYGWGGRTLDVANWQPHEMHYGTSLWGHERTWLPPDKMEEAHALRAKAAADAQREPVQVMPGNYVMSHGVCPWWDQVKAGTAKS